MSGRHRWEDVKVEADRRALAAGTTPEELETTRSQARAELEAEIAAYEAGDTDEDELD